MIISFKFSVFDLKIEHKILKELGEFTIFCMKAIDNDMKIEDISDIIQIKQDIIKKQLAFTISRKYLTDDFILTEKGMETVELFEFINLFNQQKIQIALEHYIENNSKLFYLASNKKLEDINTGYLVKDNLFDYKILYKFYEIIEKDKSKIKDFLLNDFESYKNIIEKYLDDFIFKIEKIEKQKFYNCEINEDNFIAELNNTQNTAYSCISIDIPILEINKIITSEILDTEHIDKIKAKFDQYKYFNLINGKSIQVESKSKSTNSNLKIKPLISKKSIIKNHLDSKEIWLNDFIYVDMKTEIKEFYQTKFFDITQVMENI